MASAAGDEFFYACVDQYSHLAPENSRFYCACQTANFQEHEAEAMNGEEFDLNAIQKACKTTINPYYEYMDKIKLLAGKKSQNLDWTSM